MTTKKMIIIAIAISITFVQEQLFLMIPNFQLTVLLVLLFSRYFTFKESVIYIFIYVFLDSLYMGSLNYFYMAPMLIGWMMIPLAQKLFLHKTNSEFTLAVFGFVFGFLYSWSFIPFKIIEQGITQLWPYVLMDIPFEVILAVTGFITIYFLYKPLNKVLEDLFSRQGIVPKRPNRLQEKEALID